MSLFLLLIWQILFLLRPLEWPFVDVDPSFPLLPAIMGLALIAYIMEPIRKINDLHLFLIVSFQILVLLSALLNGWLGGGITAVQSFLFTAVIPYYIYAGHAVPLKRHEFLLKTLILSALIMVWNGISQQNETGLGWAGSSYVQNGRITYLGVLNDPNDLGGFLVMCVPFTIYFITKARGIPGKFLNLLFLGYLGYGIYLTNSRGALLAMLVMAAAYGYFRLGMMKSMMAGLLCSPLLFFILSRFRTIELEESSEGRADAWYAGMDMFESSPLWGVGMGNFMEYHIRTAHNSYVLVLAELGAVGYTLWFSFIFLSILMTFLVLLKEQALPNPEGIKPELAEALQLNKALFYSFLGYLVAAFFLSRSYVIFPYLLCAFALASYTRVKNLDDSFSIGSMGKWFRISVGATFSTIVGMYVIVRVLI